MEKSKVVVLDGHIAHLANLAGHKEDWYELFLDDDFLKLIEGQHKEAVKFIKKSNVFETKGKGK